MNPLLSSNELQPNTTDATERGQSSNDSSSKDNFRHRPLLYPLKRGNFDILYSEEGDGEILVEYSEETAQLNLITCVDISTLYKEKRQKAIDMANEFQKLKHPNLLCLV